MKRFTLSTYALQTPNGRVLANLVHGNRLKGANTMIPDVKRYWASSKPRKVVERAFVLISTSPQIEDELKRILRGPISIYDEFATITKTE